MSLYLIPGLEKIQGHRTEQSTHCAMGRCDAFQVGPNNPLLMKCFFSQSKLTMEGGAGYTGARPQSSTSLSPPSHLAMPQVD